MIVASESLPPTDRISDEPESRGVLPPKPDEDAPPSSKETINMTETGTQVMNSVQRPSNVLPFVPWRGRTSARPSGRPPGASDPPRASRLSIDMGRPSRLASLRHTIMSMLPPIPISRDAGPFFVIGLLIVSILGGGFWVYKTGRMPKSISRALHLPQSRAEAEVLPPPTATAEDVPVDEDPFPTLKRGRSPMPGGVFYIPQAFTARDDGQYDLAIHFHGNTELVVQSFEAVQLDAVVAVLNLGNGSGPYEDKFANPAAFQEVLARAQEALVQQGLPHPKLRRIALVGWSAGYGAVIRILDHPADADRVDAVILLDGLHTSYREGTQIVDGLKIASVIPFAKRAMTGEKLFLINHSDIDPVTYLSVHATTDYVLKELGIERHSMEGTTPYPKLKAMDNILPTDQMVPLERESEARSGDFIVRGFHGTQAYHHVAHLVQLSTLGLPELVARWQK